MNDTETAIKAIQKTIERHKERENTLRAAAARAENDTIAAMYDDEIQRNRGFIDGCRYALGLLEWLRDTPEDMRKEDEA